MRTAVALGMAFGLALAARASDADDMARFQKLWQQQRDEVKSARVKCRTLRQCGDYFAKLTREQVNAELDKADLSTRPENLAAFIAKLRAGPQATALPWGEYDLSFEGDRLRTDGHQEDVTNTICHDGKVSVEAMGTNQSVVLRNAGQSLMGTWTLRDMRISPEIEPAHVKGMERSAGRVTLELARDDGGVPRMGRMVIDDRTGFVVRLTTMRGQAVVKEVVQGTPRTFPGGIEMPPFVARFDYGRTANDALLSAVKLVYIDSAEFNAPLPSDTFTVGVEAGTDVIDHRNDPAGSVVQGGPAADVVALADGRPTGGAVSRSGRVAIGVVAGLALLGLVGTSIAFKRLPRRR